MRLKKRYIPDLVQMAAVCEANYIRLLKLLPDERQNRTFSIGTDSSTVKVMLQVTEEHPYTTMLELQQQGMFERKVKRFIDSYRQLGQHYTLLSMLAKASL